MEELLSHCARFLEADKSIFLAFFLGGLTGGFTHCLSMCGPFVACERACASRSCGMKRRSIGNATGIHYHLGRFTTYGALGFAVALLSSQIAAFGWWPKLSSLMLALAGMMFLFSCIQSGGPEQEKRSRLTYIRGVLLGFMPCGLLYAALMMAATLANPVSGMIAMWLFTLGTVPALLLASGSAELLSRKWHNAMQRVGRAMMAINGLSLLVMAAKLVR